MREVVARVVGEPGLEWWGLARGGSFVDAIEAAAAGMPGAVLDVCTFMVGHRDAARLAALGVRRVMACRTMMTMRDGREEARMREALGDRMRMGWTHAKFAVFSLEGRAVTILTSANATRNLRWESYLVTDCPALAAVLLEHLDELDRLGAEPFRGSDYYLATFQRAMRGALRFSPSASLEELIGGL